MKSSALIVGNCRYWLKRVIGEGRRIIVWCMLNPSTADHRKDDATIRRVMRFSKDWGYDIVIVVNFFAFRSRNPKVLKPLIKMHGLLYVTGEDNQFWQDYWIEKADRLVIGWGNNLYVDPVEIAQMFPDAYCLGLTKSLQPKHPLMIKAITKPKLYLKEAFNAE